MIQYQIVQFENDLGEKKYRIGVVNINEDNGDVLGESYLLKPKYCTSEYNTLTPYETSDKQEAKRVIEEQIRIEKRQNWKEIKRENYPYQREDQPHVCTLMGYNPMIDPLCPRCEYERERRKF